MQQFFFVYCLIGFLCIVMLVKFIQLIVQSKKLVFSVIATWVISEEIRHALIRASGFWSVAIILSSLFETIQKTFPSNIFMLLIGITFAVAGLRCMLYALCFACKFLRESVVAFQCTPQTT